LPYLPIMSCEVGQNKKVVASLRPPLPCFGYFSPSLAPKEEKVKVPELINHVTSNLEAYGFANYLSIALCTTCFAPDQTICFQPSSSG